MKRIYLIGWLAAAVGLAACHGTRLSKIARTIDTFTQGAANQSDLAFQQKPALVDVLFVVDNSPSMCEKQQALISKFQQFIGVLQQQNMDFQVGVTTTDFSNSQFQGKLVSKAGNPKVLTANTPNLAQVFSDNVLAVGTNGSANSEGLLGGLAAVTDPLASGANMGLVRGNASLAVIMVSDEDDNSLTAPPPPQPDGGQGDEMVTFFTRSFENLKGPGEENLITVSAIVGADAQGNPADCAGTSTSSCTFNDATGHAAYRYAAVANGTGGLVESICANDFGPLLTTLASHVGGLTRSFTIGSIPTGQQLDPSTLTITVTPVSGAPYDIPQDPTNGWSYDPKAQAINFNGTGVPPPDSQVSISYTLLQSSFPLTEHPQTGSITVTVTAKGGAPTPVPETTTDPTQGWSYDSTANAVVFAPSSIPPSGSTVDVSYFY